MVTDPFGGKLEMTGKDGKRVLPNLEEGPARAAEPQIASTTPHANFANALLGKEKLACPVRYGVLLSALMDALYESASSGKVVKVAPVPAEI